jgi:hypothetical protein
MNMTSAMQVRVITLIKAPVFGFKCILREAYVVLKRLDAPLTKRVAKDLGKP